MEQKKHVIVRIFAVIGSCLIIDAWLLGIFAPVQQASASEYALGISPAIIEHVAQPETSISTQVIIANNTHFPLPIKGSIRPFLATEKIEEPLLPRFDASQWIQIEPRDFILQPGERKEIAIVITAPVDAEPGGHYATLIFEPLIPREALTYDSTISLARISSLVLLIVPGDIVPSLSVKDWTLATWKTFGPLTASLNIANDGNVHLLPQITITTYNLFGQSIDSTTINTATIMPGTVREFTLESAKHLLIGPYYLQTEVVYGAEHTTINSQSPTIWFIPWPYLCMALIVLTVCHKLFIVGRKRLALAWRVLTTGQSPKNL